MAAVLSEERDEQSRARRNIRLALAVAMFALCCYVGIFVIYLTAAG